MDATKDYMDWVLPTIPVGVTVNARAAEDRTARLDVRQSLVMECNEVVEREFVLLASTSTAITLSDDFIAVFVSTDGPIDVDVGGAGEGIVEGISYLMLDNLDGLDTVEFTNDSIDDVQVHVVMLRG